MSDDDANATEAPTRRTFLTCGGAAAVSGLLAGCVGGGDSEDGTTPTPTDEAGDGPTPTEVGSDTSGEAESGGDGTTDGDGEDADSGSSDSETGDSADQETYTVTMAPSGQVTFEDVPERWLAYDGGYADMAVALGQADGVTGLGNADRYYTYVYDEVPGVGIDRDRIEEHPEVRDEEEFYALDSDVHLYDPRMLINWFEWDQEEVDEVADRVGPFAGNLIFRRSDEWHDYRYYTLYEAFEKVAEVFQQRERFEAFRSFHDEFIADVQSRLPPEEERPSVMLTFEGTVEPETFSPYRLTDEGTSKKQWLDLGVEDALVDTGIENLSTENRGELDYENLLSVDPDVLLVRGHERKTPAEFRDTVLAYMEDHPIGGELTAVREGQVYRGGFLYQGPIQNLFQTERAAQQLFPEVFGEVTGDEELFDRERVADIVKGEI